VTAHDAAVAAVDRLLAAGLPAEALSDFAERVLARVEAGRPGPVTLTAHLAPRRVSGACVSEEHHYPAAHLLGRP
jgi:hypothetical protein